MRVCPRQCHFGCVVVGIEHGVHGREARVALDVVAVVALAVPRVSLSSHCHSHSSRVVHVHAILRFTLLSFASWTMLDCLVTCFAAY